VNSGCATRPRQFTTTSASASPRCMLITVAMTLRAGGYGRQMPANACVGGGLGAFGSSAIGRVMVTRFFATSVVSRTALTLMPDGT